MLQEKKHAFVVKGSELRTRNQKVLGVYENAMFQTQQPLITPMKAAKPIGAAGTTATKQQWRSPFLLKKSRYNL